MNSLAEAATKLVDILSPFGSEERMRVVQASLTLLGETSTFKNQSGATQGVGKQDGNDDDSTTEMSTQGKVWMKRNNVTIEQLEHCLHFDSGKVEPIALPGSATKNIDKVINTYLITGLASFLATGEASFSDQTARGFCEHFGCYDGGNHTKNMKGLGNRITGSKSAGWKLTAPGMTAALALVRPA